jgi:flagellar basal body-associated protein FliL
MRKNFLPLLIVGLLALVVTQMAPAPHAFAEEAAAKKGDSAKSDEGGKSKKGADDVTGGRFVGDPIYVHIAPLVLPIIADDGVEQLVTLSFDVQVKDFDAADDLHTNMPRVMDSLMRALYGGLGEGTLRNGKLANVAKVKNKATEAVGEVIGNDKIVDVLVQGVSQRML